LHIAPRYAIIHIERVKDMRALIIEDEKRLAAALKRIMEDEAFHCDAVYDGTSGIDRAGNGNYDVIILDVMLPDIDGFDVVRALRANRVSTPVIMLTAKDSIPDKVNGLNAGADDYMTKPFSPVELIARVKALTRRSGEIIINTLEYHDITLDLASGDLSCGSKTVHLSPKEFEVMRILIANRASAVRKETLILNAWGSDSSAEDNNVEAYISFLRRKLRFLDSRVVIRNLQKIGYRLETEE